MAPKDHLKRERKKKEQRRIAEPTSFWPFIFILKIKKEVERASGGKEKENIFKR